MAELDALGIKQYYYRQGIDTSTAHGRAMVQMAVVFAELEHSIIKDRINAGLARARAEGIRLGRPPLDKKIKDAVFVLKREGKSMRQIGKEVGISAASVHKVIAAKTA